MIPAVSEVTPRTSVDVSEPPDFASEGLARRAWEFAAEAHAGQRRKGDGSPYMLHPLEVAEIIVGDRADEGMVAAALLHDVLEDTETEPARIADLFGSDVGELVYALSDDSRITDYASRKRALRSQVDSAGSRAQRIYAADKLANSRELLRAWRAEGEAIEGRYKAPISLRILIWREDLRMVRSRLGETPVVTALEEQLETLEAERSATSA